jgi:hypothetical protein
MSDIFISHSTHDSEQTEQIVDMLQHAGFDVWVDFHILRDGVRWVKAIESGIDGSDAVVVVWSKNAMQSEWVERECLYALDAKKPMFVVLIEMVRLRLYLINIQYTDCTQSVVDGMAQLIETLRQTIATRAQTLNYAIESVSGVPMEGNFFDYVGQLPDGEIAMWVAKDLYTWAQVVADEIDFGGSHNPVYHVRVDIDGKPVTVLSIWAYPKTPSAQIPLGYFCHIAPFDDRRKRLDVIHQLNDIVLMYPNFVDDYADRRPTVPLHYLNTPEKLGQYKQVIAMIIDALRGATGGG